VTAAPDAVGFCFTLTGIPKTKNRRGYVFKISYRTIGSAGALVLLQVSLAAPAWAQLPPPPPNATPLQGIMFTAVANMCVNALDTRTPEQRQAASAQTNDLHEQCHAIAGANLVNGAGGAAPDSALGALQQVSGNQISTQGSLATRVSAGQFGNITGRLNALRFGSGAVLSQGFTAQNMGFGNSIGSGTETFSFDRASLESAHEGYLQPISLQSAGLPYGGSFIRTGYGGGGGEKSYRVAQAGSPARTDSGGFAPGGVQNPWGVFLQGSYNSGRHDQTDNEDPFDFHAVSVTGGVDYNFGNAVLGVSVGHDNYDAGIRASGTAVSGGSTRLKGTSGSLYGAWFGPAWYFNGIFTYGKLKSDLSREVKYSATYAAGFDPQSIPGGAPCPPTATTCNATVDRVLNANPDGTAYAFGATAGYQYAAFGWDFTPSLSINYRRSKFDSFSETDPNLANDGLGLSFDERTIESLRSILGVQVSKPISVSFGVVSPVVRLEWNHEFKTGERSIAAHYAFDPSCVNGVCDSNFALPTDTPASNYGVAGAGVVVTLAQRIQVFVLDEAQFGYSKYHSNSISLGVRGQL
jgi:uncharacterized protein YhjY with autotransporter beta-barrel domain